MGDQKPSKKARIVVSVRDISCATCALAIEKQVKNLEGVKDVRAAIMLNKIFVDYDPRLVDSESIKRRIDKTGYKAYMTIREDSQNVHRAAHC